LFCSHSQLNANGDNTSLLAAILCAALYPNVVKVLTPEKSFAPSAAGAVPKEFRADELRFKTRDDGYVSKEILASLNEVLGVQWYLKLFLLSKDTVIIFLIIVTYCFIIKIFQYLLCSHPCPILSYVCSGKLVRAGT
jgi:ATP-dependent RNA helicase DHX57